MEVYNDRLHIYDGPTDESELLVFPSSVNYIPSATSRGRYVTIIFVGGYNSYYYNNRFNMSYTMDSKWHILFN